jgi:hypothetical protein
MISYTIKPAGVSNESKNIFSSRKKQKARSHYNDILPDKSEPSVKTQ